MSPGEVVASALVLVGSALALLAVLGHDHLVAQALEAHAQDLDIVGDIVDDQDTSRIAHQAPRISRTLASIWRGL